MNSLYTQYEIGYPQLESRDQATGASFGFGFDKAPIVDKTASPRRRSRRGPRAAAHGGAHRRLRSVVARVARDSEYLVGGEVPTARFTPAK